MSIFNDYTSINTQVFELTAANANNIDISSNIIALAPDIDLIELTGFMPPAYEGGFLFVINRDMMKTIIIKNDNAGSLPGNRIGTPGGVDYNLLPKSSINLIWDNGCWIFA